MRYSNLHTHTAFSDGKHSPEENVLSAIEKNMLSLGFSDHSFTACDTSYCMKEEQYQAYLESVEAMKEKYAGQIPIFTGMELDYYSEPVDGAFDYLIASVHYIVNDGICYPIDHSLQQQIDCRDQVFNGDILAMASCYFDMLCEHVERVKPTVVGHFDVITKFGLMPEEDEAYRALAERALKRVLKTCPYVEMNTGGIARGWRTTPYPCRYLLKTLREEGGRIVLNSDSHHKDNLIFWFDEAAALLKEEGFDCIYAFNGTGFDRLPL